MANENVSFTINANTKPAGKALLELSRLINKAVNVDTKNADKNIIAQQREYKKLGVEVNKVFKDIKALNEVDKQNGGKAQLPFNQYAANEKKIADLQESAKTASTEAERKQINADIKKYKEANAKMDDYAQQALKQLLGTEKSIVSDEQSILGIKTETVTKAKETADNTKDAAVAEENLADKTKQANAGFAETADNAKKAKDAIKDATKQANSGKAEPIDMNAKETAEDVENMASAAERAAFNIQRVSEAMKMDSAKDNIAELVRRLETLKHAKRDLEKSGLPEGFDSAYNEVITKIAEITRQIREYKSNLNGVANGHRDIAKSSRQLRSLPSLLAIIKKGFKDWHKDTNRVKHSFDSMAKSMRANLKHMITSITKYVLGFRSLFFLVRRLRRYIGEGIKNMAQFNGGLNHVNSSITRLLSSLLFLKNAWATAFSPILQFVTPWLEALIDRIAEAGNAFSRFLGSILGQTQVFQAVKVKAADYADGLKNVGGSASGAADKTKKLTDRLAAFDDLNVLGVDKDPDKNRGGGGGGYDNKYEPNPNDMFKLVTIADDLKRKFQEMWAFADFSELGANLAAKLKERLENLLAEFPEIKETAHRIGESIGTFITGALQDPTVFKDMGSVLAEGLNTAGEFISGLFDGYEEGSIGTAIAEFFRGLFTDFDWKLAADNLSRFVSGLFTELTTLIREFPRDELISGITEFFESIDWAAVVSAIFSFIGASAGVIGAIMTGISTVLRNITSDDIIAAFEQVDWQAVADGLGELLGGALALAFTSVELTFTIAKAIITGIANSWVGAMKEAGLLDQFLQGLQEVQDGDFWQGVYDIGAALLGGIAKGIEDAFVNAVDWVEEHLAGPIVEGFCSLFQIASPSKLTEQWGIWLVEGIANGLVNLAVTVMEPFIKLKEDLEGKWTEIKTSASEKWTDIKNKLAEKATDIKSKLSEVWTNIRGDAYTAWVLLRVSAVQAFTQLKDALKSPINGVIAVVESMINKIISGINSVVSKINTIPDIKFTNPFTGTEYKLGFSIPKLSSVSIPRLAQGAVIPPNREFMAVLGDQSHGTNIEAPLDTIKQAVAEVINSGGYAEMIQLLQELITVVQNKNLVIGDKEIGKANARYVNQQRMIRGTNI